MENQRIGYIFEVESLLLLYAESAILRQTLKLNKHRTQIEFLSRAYNTITNMTRQIK